MLRNYAMNEVGSKWLQGKESHSSQVSTKEETTPSERQYLFSFTKFRQNLLTWGPHYLLGGLRTAELFPISIARLYYDKTRGTIHVFFQGIGGTSFRSHVRKDKIWSSKRNVLFFATALAATHNANASLLVPVIFY